MTVDRSPYAGRSPWVVDPDFNIWLPNRLASAKDRPRGP
jgi:hypothetical protein